MQSTAVVALALLESASAFTAPSTPMRSVSRASATMFSEGDLGVLPPLGVFDPLGLIETRDMRRYEIMEIKHGRGAPRTQPWRARDAASAQPCAGGYGFPGPLHLTPSGAPVRCAS